MATSSGRACAISWRRKMSSTPTSLATAVMLAGSRASEIAGTGGSRRAAATQSIAQSLASVAEPPLPKRISFPPRGRRSRMAAMAAPIASACSRGDLRRAALRIVLRPSSEWTRRLRRAHVVGILLLLAEEGVEEAGVARIETELAVLEEDVHGLPQRVVENLDDFLMDERIGRGGARSGNRLRRRAEPGSCAPRWPCERRAPSILSGRLRAGRTPSPCRRAAESRRARGGSRARDRAPAARACRRSPDARTRPRHAARRSRTDRVRRPAACRRAGIAPTWRG